MEYYENKEKPEKTAVVLNVQNDYKQNVFSDTNRLIFKRLRHLNSTKVSGFRKPAVSENWIYISFFPPICNRKIFE